MSRLCETANHLRCIVPEGGLGLVPLMPEQNTVVLVSLKYDTSNESPVRNCIQGSMLMRVA